MPETEQAGADKAGEEENLAAMAASEVAKHSEEAKPAEDTAAEVSHPFRPSPGSLLTPRTVLPIQRQYPRRCLSLSSCISITAADTGALGRWGGELQKPAEQSERAAKGEGSTAHAKSPKTKPASSRTSGRERKVVERFVVTPQPVSHDLEIKQVGTRMRCMQHLFAFSPWMCKSFLIPDKLNVSVVCSLAVSQGSGKYLRDIPNSEWHARPAN
jgi:hypothetical protein